MRYTVRKSVLYVVGKLWIPMVTAATDVTLSDYDIRNMRDDNGRITRDSVEDWIGSHCGDFSSVEDFSASIEDGENTVEIPWASEDGEMAYLDCMSPAED